MTYTVAPPFPKDAVRTAEHVQALAYWLTSIMAFHPLTADRPWLFYENIDQYLGPWGQRGYPIAYGKKYCQLFYGNIPLNADTAGALWVQRTLLLLQQELVKFILDRFRAGTLKTVTADEFRQAAFASHPKAYTEAGLTTVVLLAPDLVAAIATIPSVEFKPTSPTFGPTFKQLIDTTGIVIPQVIGTLLAALSGPAHTQVLSVASARDQMQLQSEIVVMQKFKEVFRAVTKGRCDHLGLLGRLREVLVVTTFTNAAADRAAATLVDAIDARINYVQGRYMRESSGDPSLRRIFEEFDEDACTWSP